MATTNRRSISRDAIPMTETTARRFQSGHTFNPMAKPRPYLHARCAYKARLMYLRFASTPGWSAVPSPLGSVHVGLPRPHPPAPPDGHTLRSRQRRPGPCHLLSRLSRVHLPCRTTNRPRSAGFPALCVHTPRFAPTPPHHPAGFICSLRSHTAPPPRRIYMFAALTKPA